MFIGFNVCGLVIINMQTVFLFRILDYLLNLLEIKLTKFNYLSF